jgi:2-dehydropantoate 2-reductase
MQYKKTIAVIGSGAVGSYYGGRLAQAGQDVRFLLRRDYHAVSLAGFNITSPDGNFVLPNPGIYRTSEEIGAADWIICALKATSLYDAHKLIQPCVGPHTRILVLMNGLGLEDHFAGWFGGEKVFGGLAFTCINRGKPGNIHHLGYGKVTIGHYLDSQSELAEARSLWNNCKAEVVTAPSLLQARWEKLCWNIPFSGLCVAGGGITTDKILADHDLSSSALALMQEVIDAGNADLEAHAEKTRIDGPNMIERMFKMTSTMGDYRPSAMIDFVEGHAMEIEAIFGEPLKRARSLKINTPRLNLLTAVLKSLNRER